MPELKNLDKAVAMAGGCIAFASGAGTAALGVSAAAGGASLLGLWWDRKAQYNPESQRVLARVRDRVRREFEGDFGLSEDNAAILEGADFALGQILLDCIPPLESLAAAYGDKDGFAKAAARMVVTELAARDDLFAETGERADAVARRFAFVTVQTALSEALTDRDYFSSLLPFVLEAIAGGVEAARTETSRIRATVDRTEASVDVIADGVRRMDDRLGDILRLVQGQTEVPLATLEAILGAMGDSAAGDDAALIERRLRQKAAEYRELVDRLNRLSNDDPEVGRLRSEAAKALGRGDFAQADGKLAAAEARDLAGLDDLEALARHKRLSAAESRAERGEAAMLRANPCAYREAANHFARAAEIAAVVDVDAACTHRMSQADSYYRLGEEFGDRSALHDAILRLRAILTRRDRERVPLDWAKTQNNLGIVLATLGLREPGSSRLEEATAAFRAALQERTRKRVPLQWAQTQLNLGSALAYLGERAGSKTQLEEAVVAYRAALEELARDQAPLDWAKVQTGLGATLFRLGERENETERLEEAVVAFRAALEIQDREQSPLDWAMTQSNLGAALQTLGDRRDGPIQLDAVIAFRAALEEFRRDRVPLDWAMTQNNLGNALRSLGERESGIKRLKEALVAFEAALEEYTRDRVPLNWAAATLNAVETIGRIAERTADRSALGEATASARQARDVAVAAGHEPLIAWGDQVLSLLDSIGRASAR